MLLGFNSSCVLWFSKHPFSTLRIAHEFQHSAGSKTKVGVRLFTK